MFCILITCQPVEFYNVLGSRGPSTTKADKGSCQWTDSSTAWADAHGHTAAATTAIVL